MKKPLTILFLLLCCVATSNQAAVLTFDDITTSPEQYPISTYGGLNWDNMGILSSASQYPGSGYENGTVSGDYIALNGYGDSMTVSGPVFDFMGAYLTAAWHNDLQIHVAGRRNGVVLYSQTIAVDTFVPTWFSFNFFGVDELMFYSYGGTDADPVNGKQFAMDNFTYISAAPIPATVWLFSSGIMGMIGFSKRKKAVRHN